MTAKKVISWDELAKHNTSSDCWLAIRGRVYDVTSWIPKHPGGNDTIVLNGGRDATQLFEAYHPAKVQTMLANYDIGGIEKYDVDHPAFPPMSEFYRTLKIKIEDYFIQNKISPRYAPEMLLRAVILVSLAFIFHYLAITCSSFETSFLFAALSGVAFALICFMPVHEGSHASTTESAWAWRAQGAIHDFVNGASFYTWCHQHFLGHHPFTNVTIDGKEKEDAIDPDIATSEPDVRRIKPNQRWHEHYKFQMIYAPMLYGLLGMKFRINDIMIVFFLKTNGAIRLNPLDNWHMFAFVAGKLFFLWYRIILPMMWCQDITKPLWVFLVADLVTSYILAFVFQVNHVVALAKWPTVNQKTGIVNMDWAEMQLSTTIDYAHDSWLTTFFTGALNYQVTHHLFPYVSQIHYPKIAPIIKDHCQKHGFKYHVLPTFWDAFCAHLSYLAKMGHAHYDL